MKVKSFVQPSAQTVAAFNAFASANGVKPTVISPNEDWMSLTLPVSQANMLFAANFEVFTHLSSSQTLTRTLSVSLPSQLVGHVDVISPTTDFINPNPHLTPWTNVNLAKRGPAPSCNTSDASGIMTPACLQDLYGIPTAPATQPNNGLLVTGYVDNWAQSADLSVGASIARWFECRLILFDQTFLSLLRPDIPSNTTFSLLTIDNGTNPQGPNDGSFEANLDIQYTMGIHSTCQSMARKFDLLQGLRLELQLRYEAYFFVGIVCRRKANV
jgi:tripeptidyl-peptidase-1